MIGLVPLTRFSPEIGAGDHRAQPVLRGRPLPAAHLRRGHQLHLRRPLLQRRSGRRATRALGCPRALRRGMVRLRQVPPHLPRTLCHGRPGGMPDRPTIFSVQSTHKMLAAFSMGSMIHVKLSERGALDFDQFNESFMMHGTTSPFYPLIASLDVAAAMMDEPAGPTLMDETLADAISFRKAMTSVGAPAARANPKRRRLVFRHLPARVRHRSQDRREHPLRRCGRRAPCQNPVAGP